MKCKVLVDSLAKFVRSPPDQWNFSTQKSNLDLADGRHLQYTREVEDHTEGIMLKIKDKMWK